MTKVWNFSLQFLMPYLTISRLFVEIWTMCNPEEAQGNEKASLNVPCNSAGHLDPEIFRCSVVPEKKNWTVCSPEDAQGNEMALLNACPSAGNLDPEISRCNAVPGKTKNCTMCSLEEA